MGWFYALESPTQVAIFGVLAGIVTAIGAVTVAAVNTIKAGGGSNKAELAALTIDSTAVLKVATAIDGMTEAIAQQIQSDADGRDSMVIVLKNVAREIEELRREVRALSDKLRGHS